MSTCPLIIDFEASSVFNEGSYPIEMAWTRTDGQIVSHLIDISPVMNDVYWSEDSEMIHSISLDDLLTKGKDATEVVQEFINDLGGRKVVFSDGPSMDYEWMQKLFAMAGQKPPFAMVQDYNALILTVVKQRIGDVSQAKETVDSLVSDGVDAHRLHRAGDDVLALRNTYIRAMHVRPKITYAMA
ncbi:exonuclease domain-containing protein [Pseudomonas luteola]